jgi:hypothetical protein
MRKLVAWVICLLILIAVLSILGLAFKAGILRVVTTPFEILGLLLLTGVLIACCYHWLAKKS